MMKQSKQGKIMIKIQRGFLLVILLTIVVLLISGCAAVGPDYVREESASPENWHTQLQGGLIAAQMDPVHLARWWTVLEDSQLTALEEQAIKGNLDLKVAQARIREARAMRGISRAQFFPTLDSDLAVTKSRSSESSGTGTVFCRV